MDKREVALLALENAQSLFNPTEAHIRADLALCDLLATLGYGDVVAKFNAIPKGHA